MIRRILAAAILIPIVLASLFLLPRVLFVALLSLVLWLALRELKQIASRTQVSIFPATFLTALGLLWLFNYAPSYTAPLLIAAVLVTLGWTVVTCTQVDRGFSDAAGNLLGLAYLALPISLMGTFHSSQGTDRPRELLFVLLVVWISDAAALFTGRAIGRHQITPTISPNKTLEGYVAAVLFPVLIGLPLGSYLLPGRTLIFLLAATVVISVAGILGDLFESLLKRGAQVKDSSNLIPGHGGILDRIDSLLLAVPAFHLLTRLWIISV